MDKYGSYFDIKSVVADTTAQVSNFRCLADYTIHRTYSSTATLVSTRCIPKISRHCQLLSKITNYYLHFNPPFHAAVFFFFFLMIRPPPNSPLFPNPPLFQ